MCNRLHLTALFVGLLTVTASTAYARQIDFLSDVPQGPDRPTSAFAGVTFAAANSAPASTPLRLDFHQATQAPPVTPRPKAFVYSDGYRTRAKIHRYASFATLPLFVAEGFLGESLYQNPTQSKKTAHLAVATGIGTLFGINGVTGVWNLLEARKDPTGHTKRTIHGILMIAASGGFFATAATAPESELRHNNFSEGDGNGNSRALHRGIAFTSIGLATASYLIMLFGR